MSYSEFFPSSSQPKLTLHDFSQDELYRLFVDEKLVNSESGWTEYETREPGCIAALCKAAEIAWFQDMENKEINLDLIKSLHRCVTTGVQKLNSMDFTPGEFRKNFTGFPISGYTKKDEQFSASKRGLFDIFRLILRQKSAGYDSKEHQTKTAEDFKYIRDHSKEPEEKKEFAPRESHLGDTGSSISFPLSCYGFSHLYTTHEIEEDLDLFFVNQPHKKAWPLEEKLKVLSTFIINKMSEIRYRAPAPHIIPLEMESIIKSYNAGIKLAKTEEDKLVLIAKTIWEFEHTHPFRDANIRVFAILLCNRLLMQQGLGLAIFSDPNIFNGLGKKELAHELKKAIENAQQVVNKIKTGDIAFKTQSIPESERARFREWSKTLFALAQKEHQSLSPSGP
ncbi:MAG: Fic family protein [Gammaproteobacteria bacterium]